MRIPFIAAALMTAAIFMTQPATASEDEFLEGDELRGLLLEVGCLSGTMEGTDQKFEWAMVDRRNAVWANQVEAGSTEWVRYDGEWSVAGNKSLRSILWLSPDQAITNWYLVRRVSDTLYLADADKRGRLLGNGEEFEATLGGCEQLM